MSGRDEDEEDDYNVDDDEEEVEAEVHPLDEVRENEQAEDETQVNPIEVKI